MFSRDFWRPKTAKFKIYLILRIAGASVVALTLWRWSCPLGAGGRGCSCYFADVSKIVLMLLLFGVFPPFRLLPCFALGAFPLKYAFISVLRAFLAGFICLVWVCVVLVLCVACVVFVRVWS